MHPKYIPVDPDYLDMFLQQMEKDEARIVYFAFANEPELDETRGKITGIDDKSKDGHFLLIENGDRVRLDRIIVINGKPGPAYDEYDAYSLAQLSCQEDSELC